MQISELKNEGLELSTKVILPVTEVSKSIDEELTGLQKNAKLPGFRPGKVPLNTLRAKYAEDILTDVLKKTVQEAIKKAVADYSLDLATQPGVDNVKCKLGEDLEFTLNFERKPTLNLPDFKKVKIQKPNILVPEKDVDKYLADLAQRNATYEKEAKKAKDGYQVVLDAVGYVEGEAFEGGKLDDHKLVLGSKSFIDNFEDQLIGTKVGDDVLVKVKFPDAYHAANLAGKDAEFKVHVKAIYEPLVPEINDEFAKNLQQKDLASLKDQITQVLKGQEEMMALMLMKKELFDRLEGLLDFEVPKSLLDAELQNLKTELQKDDEDNQKDEYSDDYYAKIAMRRVRIGFLISEYAKNKSIIVNQSEVQQEMIKQARQYPGQERQVMELYRNNPRLVQSLQSTVLEQKVVRAILDNEVASTSKDYSLEEFNKFIEDKYSSDFAE